MPDTTPDTSMQMKIFVSHNHKDITVCHALVEALRGAGADVWYDEHNMGAGRLTPEVERELKARPVFVVILSPAALGSHWVEDEARWAYTLYRKDPKRIILPVLVETVNDDDIWLFLSDFRRVETPGNQPYPQEEAIRQTLRVLTLTPKGERVVTPTPHPGENPSALLIRGRALLARSQYVEALPFFEQAALRAPNSPDAWFNLGNTLNNLGRPRDGLPATERATELDADNGYAWSNMALALLRLNRYTEALEASDKALNIEETTLRFSYRPSRLLTLNAMRRRWWLAIKRLNAVPKMLMHGTERRGLSVCKGATAKPLPLLSGRLSLIPQISIQWIPWDTYCSDLSGSMKQLSGLTER